MVMNSVVISTPPPPKTYSVRTLGCQMNVHDSERISGLLEDMGYVKTEGNEPDLVVFNTCAIRENADNKLYGTLSHLAPLKKKNPAMQIAVGGCLAQKDRQVIVEKAPHVDVVFGTHNIGSLPYLLRRAQHNQTAEIEIVESLETFPSHLPARRESTYSAWVSISVGCNNTCTFCIVPSLRGKEIDRSPDEILDEIRMLVDQGITEITLLGQNVNSYGINFADSGLARNRSAFAQLLRACGEIDGLERVRFTSPHPAEFRDDVLEAMATTPNICPTLHMPLQSGANRILKLMRRSYRAERFLAIVEKARELIPNIAISTDIIVGFPSETEEDFDATMRIVKQSRFAFAYTFQYSPRPGTPAAKMQDQISPDIVSQRYTRLVELQDSISWEENKKLLGRCVKVLVNSSVAKKNHTRLSGRAYDGRLVHFVGDRRIIRPGDYVTVTITQASPHFLISDSPIVQHCKIQAGEIYASMRPSPTPSVPLGTPKIGIPLNYVKSQGYQL